MDETERTICEAVLEIAQRRSPEIKQVSRQHSLVDDFGLSSMDYAELVATLEMLLNADPFAESVSITTIRTVGDLCDAYKKVL